MRKKVLYGGLLLSTGFMAGLFIGRKVFADKGGNRKVTTSKFEGYYYILNKWLEARHHGWSLNLYFEKEGIQEIAVYGMGELGYRFIEEAEETDAVVKYCIDKNSGYGYGDIKVRNPEEDMEPVDAIIVTPFYAFDEIEETLKKKFPGRIISIEDVIEGN